MAKKTGFLDTNILNICLNRKMNGHDLNLFLYNNGIIPVIGPYTTYEIARCGMNHPEKAMSLSAITLDLNPEYICPREDLYLMEYNRFKTMVHVPYWMNDETKFILVSRLKNYRAGIFDDNLKKIENDREADLKKKRSALFGLENVMEELKNRYGKLDFDNFKQKFFKDISNDEFKLKKIQDLILVSSNGKALFTLQDIPRLLSEIDQYHALRSLINLNLYMSFHVIKHGAITKDKLPDALMATEAAYCSVFISGEKSLLTKYLPNYNSTIDRLHLNENFVLTYV